MNEEGASTRAGERSLLSMEAAAFRQLAAALAHALNNPLFVLLTDIELLLLDVDDEAVSERLREMQGHGLVLRTTIRKLGELAREPLLPEELDLGEAVGVAVARWRETSQSDELHLEERYVLPDVTVRFTPRQLERIVEELLENARQAVPHGGSVRVEVARDGDDAVLSVVDTGPGIADRVRLAVFEPFFTTRPVESNLGLGLTVARVFAALHGAELTVAGSEGEGARLELRMPTIARTT